MDENRKDCLFGAKEAAGFVTHLDVSAGTEVGPGLLSMTAINARPNDRGEAGRGPVQVEPAARASPNEPPPGLLPANGCLNADPHPAGGDVKQANTYMKRR
jgi:hypothetical protein